MPNIEKHAPGSFCWIELGTTDQNAAKNFYGSLFGWTAHDNPMGPNEVYTLFKLQGRDAAATYTLRADQRSVGVPPHWMVYISTTDADTTAKSAADAGATVLAAPFDVFDLGRMAVIQDPTGAVFSAWQAKNHAGTGITGVDGTLCWADLNTRDQSRARQFYSQVFGWKLDDDTDHNPPSGYVHIKNGQEFIGGILPAELVPPHVPPHWLPYFLVSDCDASVSKATHLGARLYLEPQTLENVGRFAVVGDPQGAGFAVFQATPRHT